MYECQYFGIGHYYEYRNHLGVLDSMRALHNMVSDVMAGMATFT